jgi:hypothetical protein
MKKLLAIALLASGLMISTHEANAQNEDKSKRPSPPAKAVGKLKSGATITIDYSQPSVKGRTIGKDLEPMEGQVWRTGANEATVFETDKDIMIGVQKLPAGKYGLFSIFNGDVVTIHLQQNLETMGSLQIRRSRRCPAHYGKSFTNITSC